MKTLIKTLMKIGKTANRKTYKRSIVFISYNNKYLLFSVVYEDTNYG